MCNFSHYYSFATLTKKSHRNDLQIYQSYLKGADWHSTQGIIKILSQARDKGRSPATVRHIFSTIRRVHNWHIDMDKHLTGRNPCDPIRLPKVDNTVTNTLDKEEVYQTLEYLKTHSNRRMAVLVSLALLTGRRQGELLKLRKEDIQDGFMVCRETKNGKTYRFPLSKKALELLNEVEPPFRYTNNGFKTNWVRLRERLLKEGIISKRIRFHDLRHTHATLLANSGKVTLHTIQKLLGHSTIDLTQRYAHLLDETLKDAVELL